MDLYAKYTEFLKCIVFDVQDVKGLQGELFNSWKIHVVNFNVCHVLIFVEHASLQE